MDMGASDSFGGAICSHNVPCRKVLFADREAHYSLRMREWTDDDDRASAWLPVEFAFLVLAQIVGLVAVIGWLIL